MSDHPPPTEPTEASVPEAAPVALGSVVLYDNTQHVEKEEFSCISCPACRKELLCTGIDASTFKLAATETVRPPRERKKKKEAPPDEGEEGDQEDDGATDATDWTPTKVLNARKKILEIVIRQKKMAKFIPCLLGLLDRRTVTLEELKAVTLAGTPLPPVLARRLFAVLFRKSC